MIGRLILAGCVLACVGATLPAEGQVHSRDSLRSGFLDFGEPGAASRRHPPSLTFTAVRQIEIPGPLRDRDGPTHVDGRVEVRVDGALVRVELPDGDPELEPVAGLPPAPADAGPTWALAPDESFRVRALSNGFILAERGCRSCARQWRRCWRLRVSGSTVSPPLVTEGRVYFGALDNRVYSLKRRNGHRIWAADVGGRVSGRVALWSGSEPVMVRFGTSDESRGQPARVRQEVPSAILVIPDGGQRIVALDAIGGAPVGEFRVGEAGARFVGSPLVLADGKIAVAVEKYNASRATLLILTLSAEEDA